MTTSGVNSVGCEINIYSSVMCKNGTKGCEVDHAPSASLASEDAAQVDEATAVSARLVDVIRNAKDRIQHEVDFCEKERKLSDSKVGEAYYCGQKHMAEWALGVIYLMESELTGQAQVKDSDTRAPSSPQRPDDPRQSQERG